MKYLFVLSLIFAFSCSTPQKQSEAEGDATLVAEVPEASFTSYGSEISPDGAENASSINYLMQDLDSANVKLTGEIEKTCKMKGCWMTVKTNEGETMRVTFEDYGFFVPKEGMEGKTAIFEGQVSKTITSVETLKHFAKDEGKSEEEIAAITEPKEEFAFVATGVLIQED